MRSHLIAAKRLAITAAVACADAGGRGGCRRSPASQPGCTTSGLVAWSTPEGAAGGQLIYTLKFTNLSGHTCTL